jgi:hypothetical protein
MHAERTRKWRGGEKFSALQTAEEYGLPLVAELLGRRCPEPVAPRRWAVAMVAVVDGPRPSHRRTRCGGAHRRLGPSCSASTSTRIGRFRPRRSSCAAAAGPRPPPCCPSTGGLGRVLGLVPPHDHGEERRLLLPPTRHCHPGDPGLGVATSGSSVGLWRPSTNACGRRVTRQSLARPSLTPPHFPSPAHRLPATAEASGYREGALQVARDSHTTGATRIQDPQAVLTRWADPW